MLAIYFPSVNSLLVSVCVLRQCINYSYAIRLFIPQLWSSLHIVLRTILWYLQKSIRNSLIDLLCLQRPQKSFFAHIVSSFSPHLFTINNSLYTNHIWYFDRKIKRLSFSATGFYSLVSCNIDYMSTTLNWNYVRHPFRLTIYNIKHTFLCLINERQAYILSFIYLCCVVYLIFVSARCSQRRIIHSVRGNYFTLSLLGMAYRIVHLQRSEITWGRKEGACTA